MTRKRRKKPTTTHEDKKSGVPQHDPALLIPTGSTMLNLACSNHWYGGYKKGKIVNLVGDSHAGKSILALTTLALCANDPQFDDYELIYDDTEEASEFDLEEMFGSVANERIKAPKYDKAGTPLFSGDIEQWQDTVHDKISGKHPCIYITDSFDSLHSEEDEKKAIEQQADREKGNKTKGTYGTAKPKMASFVLRRMRQKIKHTNSLLLIVSQTRDNLSAVSFAEKTRSGGRALKFYSTHEMWGAVKGKITRTVDKEKFEIGSDVKLNVTKNKLTGRSRKVEFPIYDDFGVDDVSSCVDWLCSKGVIKESKEKEKEKKSLKFKALDLEAKTKKELIQEIEKNDLETELSKECHKEWMRVENALKMEGRKKRF